MDHHALAAFLRARIADEVAAKQDVIDRCVFYLDNYRGPDCSGEWLADDVLVFMAQPYASHPEFQEEWKP